jgi:hypothetical protein
MNDTIKKNLESICRHIIGVQNDAKILAPKIVDMGHPEIAAELLSNSLCHDASKFLGKEYAAFVLGDKSKLVEAIKAHRVLNSHHIEYWGDPQRMPVVYIAEMACDLHSRSSEFGTDVRGFINNTMSKTYGFKEGDKFHRKLIYFLDMLLEKPFEHIV